MDVCPKAARHDHRPSARAHRAALGVGTDDPESRQEPNGRALPPRERSYQLAISIRKAGRRVVAPRDAPDATRRRQTRRLHLRRAATRAPDPRDRRSYGRVAWPPAVAGCPPPKVRRARRRGVHGRVGVLRSPGGPNAGRSAALTSPCRAWSARLDHRWPRARSVAAERRRARVTADARTI